MAGRSWAELTGRAHFIRMRYRLTLHPTGVGSTFGFSGLNCQQKNLCSRTPQLSFTRCKTNLIMLQIFDSVVGHIHSYPGWQGSWGLWWACRLGVCSSATHFAKLRSPYHSTWNSARVCPQELSCPGGAGISSEACQDSLPRITCHPANDQLGRVTRAPH